MHLTNAQSYELLGKYGCFARECCDKCGAILGPVRYTRRGEVGEWCSRECRNGDKAITPGRCCGCGASLQGKRRGAKWCSDTCRDRVNRSVLDSSNKGGTPAHSKRLTDAVRGFPYTASSGPKTGHFANERG